jgi:hypothetical protein
MLAVRAVGHFRDESQMKVAALKLANWEIAHRIWVTAAISPT